MSSKKQKNSVGASAKTVPRPAPGSKKRKQISGEATGPASLPAEATTSSKRAKVDVAATVSVDAARRTSKSPAATTATDGGRAADMEATDAPPQLSKRAAKFLKMQAVRKKQRDKLKQKKAAAAAAAAAAQQQASASTLVPSSSSAAAPAPASMTARRKQVKLASLGWAPVALPTEAVSSGGGNTTDADFFAGLFDGDLNDYMGLQEVKGVKVKYAAPAPAPGSGGGGSKGKGKGKADDEDEEDQGSGSDVDMVDIDEDGGAGVEESRAGKVIKFLVRDEPAVADQAAPNISNSSGSRNIGTDAVPAVDAVADASSSKTHPATTKKKKTEKGPKLSAEAKQADKVSKDGDAGGGASAERDEEIDGNDEGDVDGDDSGGNTLGQVDWSALDAFDESKLSDWSQFGLDVRLKAGLWKLKFNKPTTIQAATLPHVLARSDEGLQNDAGEDDGEGANRAPLRRDVVGVAQTGSGKTLAYGLPILHHILVNGTSTTVTTLSSVEADDDDDETANPVRPLTALILTPTRELAIQVGDHLQSLVDATAGKGKAGRSSGGGGGGKQSHHHWVSIVTVCGGMSVQKQRRLLTRGLGADIVVATPGRLWELLSEDDDFAARMKQIRFLVIDEADRMVEVGHFAEMDNILKIFQRPGEAEDVGDDLAEDLAPDEPLNAVAQSFVARFQGGRDDLQTFVFSATLSKTLQRNLTCAKRKQLSRKKRAETSTLDDLMMRVDFRDPDPIIVDLSPEAGIAEGVHEMKVECLTKDKDLYLYYFLLRYPGRTLVFLNSIDGIRRLVPILTHLGLHPFPLHSQLQQKQRLKNLDRFRAVSLGGSSSGSGAAQNSSNRPPASAVILATDVAARGLDIKGVDHVVHYQLPRSADTYVHRSGRTGRAGTEGVALAMIDPAEKRVWNEICKSLNQKDSVPAMTVEFSFFHPLRARLELAKHIDTAEHRASKESHDDAWLRKMAQDADIDLEESDDGLDEDGGRNNKRKSKGQQQQGRGGSAPMSKLKEELAALLRQPLKARGVSFKYITSGSRTGFAEEALNSSRRDIVTDAPKLLTSRPNK
ncbi:hypothetical protein V8E36_005623 [Tilletia maclaganii]